jgi:magnesium transporter
MKLWIFFKFFQIKKTENILSALSQRDRQRIQEALEYPEDSAGGLMNTDIISVRPKHNLEVVMRYLRAQRELPKNTDQIFVVSRENKYLGSLPISSICCLRSKFKCKRAHGK